MAVQQLAPLMLACVRFTTAGIIVMIIARIMGLDISINKKQLRNCFIAGFFFLTVGNGIVVWALKYVDSGFAALEISSQPLVILVMMRIMYHQKIRVKSIVGIVLGIIGMYLLVSQQSIVYQEGAIAGIVMIFIGMLSWAYATLFVARADLPPNFFINTGYQMLCGGLMLGMVSLGIQEIWIPPWQWQIDTTISMVILILFGSIAAFTAFNYLLKIVSPEKVATSTYINPIVALFLGWYVLDEQVNTQSLVAAGILLTGVYFINSSRAKPG